MAYIPPLPWQKTTAGPVALEAGLRERTIRSVDSIVGQEGHVSPGNTQVAAARVQAPGRMINLAALKPPKHTVEEQRISAAG